MNRQTEGHINMKTNKETKNRIVRNIDAHKWTDRGTDTHTKTKRERQIHKPDSYTHQTLTTICRE